MKPRTPKGKFPTSEKLLELPPFPQVALRVLDLLSREEMETRQVVEAIRVDGAFAAELLRVANSALFALPQEVKTVQHAVVILGQQGIRSLTMTVALRAYLRRQAGHEALRKCWHHSLACALIGEELAKYCAVAAEVGYVAGLLHDVGRLGLIAACPRDYLRLFQRAQSVTMDVGEMERLQFDMDHCAAGKLLAEEWKLPAELAVVAARHHDRPDSMEPVLVTLARFSCQVAEMLGFEAIRASPVWTAGGKTQQLSEAALSLWHVDMEKLKQKVGGKIRSAELEGG